MNKAEMHAEICTALNDLYQRKNHDYGDSFGKSYEEYGMTMACIRLEDKLNRLKSLCRQEALVQDESLEDTLMDLANYAIMTLVERKRSKAIADYWLEEMKKPEPEEILPPILPVEREALAKRIEEACDSFPSCEECPLFDPRDRLKSCFTDELSDKEINKNYWIMEEAGVFNRMEPKKGEHAIGCFTACLCMKCAHDHETCCQGKGCPVISCDKFQPEGEE